MKAALTLATGAIGLLLERSLALAVMQHVHPVRLGSSGEVPAMWTGSSWRTLPLETGTHLANWLNDERVKVRRASAGAFLLTSMQAVVCRNPYGRYATKASLKPLFEEIELLDALTTATIDTDPITASRAAMALYIAGTWTNGRGRRGAVSPTALACLDDSDPLVRQSAALWAYFQKADPRRAAKVLVETFDEGWFERSEVSRLLLARTDVAVPECRRLLECPNRETAARAAFILRSLPAGQDPRPAGAPTDAIDEMVRELYGRLPLWR